MALINCPECGKQVSDMANVCIHCGFPLDKEMRKDKAVIANTNNHTSVTVSSIDNFSLFSFDDNYVNIACKICNRVYKYEHKYFTSITAEKCITNTAIRCANCGNSIGAYSKILASQNISLKKSAIDDGLHCPRCGFKQVSTGQRGFSLWTGFLGSNRTVNRCGKCGYTWKPKR